MVGYFDHLIAERQNRHSCFVGTVYKNLYLPISNIIRLWVNPKDVSQVFTPLSLPDTLYILIGKIYRNPFILKIDKIGVFRSAGYSLIESALKHNSTLSFISKYLHSFSTFSIKETNIGLVCDSTFFIFCQTFRSCPNLEKAFRK